MNTWFKDNKPNKTAFVIGTGPSLNNIDITKLKDYPTISFNRSYIAYDDWGFDPTYYMAIDSNDVRAMYKDIYSLIEKSNIQKFFLTFCEDNANHPSPEHYQDGDIKDIFFTDIKSNKIYSVGGTRGISNCYIDEKNKIFNTLVQPNAGFMGVLALKALGYTEVAFVGCDSKYRIDEESNRSITQIGDGEYVSHEDWDVNHFSHKYFGKGMRFGIPNPKQILGIWSGGASIIQNMHDFSVYSCTKDSALNQWYPYIDFEDFLNGKR